MVFEYFTRPELLVRWIGHPRPSLPRRVGSSRRHRTRWRSAESTSRSTRPTDLVISWGHNGSAQLPPEASRLEIRFERGDGGRRWSPSSTPGCPRRRSTDTARDGSISSPPPRDRDRLRRDGRRGRHRELACPDEPLVTWNAPDQDPLSPASSNAELRQLRDCGRGRLASPRIGAVCAQLMPIAAGALGLVHGEVSGANQVGEPEPLSAGRRCRRKR